MRLKQSELNAIKTGVSEIFEAGDNYELFLFGSRTDDSKRGGDIDLLIVVDPTLLNAALSKKSLIKHALFQRMDEQRIDITIATRESLNSDPFLKSISASLVPL